MATVIRATWRATHGHQRRWRQICTAATSRAPTAVTPATACMTLSAGSSVPATAAWMASAKTTATTTRNATPSPRAAGKLGRRLPRPRVLDRELEQLGQRALVRVFDLSADERQPDAEQAGELVGAGRRFLERPHPPIRDELEPAAGGVVEAVVLLHEERFDIEPDVIDIGIEGDVQPVCQDEWCDERHDT